MSTACPSSLTAQKNEIARAILKEIRERLGLPQQCRAGIPHAVSRNAGTLSGGESQRIRLASQIGSGLTGVLYVLDEPSIGLHQRDNDRLLDNAEEPARPGQHRDRGRTRRGGDPRGRLRLRHRPRRRGAWRRGRGPGHARPRSPPTPPRSPGNT